MCGIFLYHNWDDAHFGRDVVPHARCETPLGGMDGQILHRIWPSVQPRGLDKLFLIIVYAIIYGKYISVEVKL